MHAPDAALTSQVSLCLQREIYLQYGQSFNGLAISVRKSLGFLPDPNLLIDCVIWLKENKLISARGARTYKYYPAWEVWLCAGLALNRIREYGYSLDGSCESSATGSL